MCKLKHPCTVTILVLAALNLLSASENGQTSNTSNQSAVSPKVLTPPPSVTREIPVEQAPQAATPPPAATAQSTDSLNLTIGETPAAAVPQTGSGSMPASDWLDSKDPAINLDNVPANDNLLPDLFNKKDREKDTSVKMKMHVDESEQDIADVIDGAGVSIKYRTD